jgi:hypothetical protein
MLETPMSYTTISKATFKKVLPSGKASVFVIDGDEVVIPHFAISDGSELHEGSSRGETDSLTIMDKIAIEKGLHPDYVEKGGGTGIGIPLKRNKLPERPELLEDEYLGRMKRDLKAADQWYLANDADPMLAYPIDSPIALFEGPNADANVVFAAQAPAFVRDLLEENAKLRAWMEEATKKANARRKRR